MLDEKWVAHWQSILETLYIVDREIFDERSRPADSHLNLLEGRLGLPLPASYSGFIKALGPGEFARYLTILSPGYHGSTVVDFIGQNKEFITNRKKRIEIQEDKYVWFGYCIHGPMIAWDITSMTDHADSEYRIHCRVDAEQFLTIADSFHDFIHQCLSGGFAISLGMTLPETWEDEETSLNHPRRCFDPRVGSPRSPV